MTPEERERWFELAKLQLELVGRVAGGISYPACNYPDHKETDRMKKYMGVYRPGKPCDKCGHKEPVC